MTWFKVDDSFHSHPKVLATSPAALGLWVVAGAWSSANLTEGFVPDHALPRLIDDPERLAKELVSNGLWRRERGGYRYHDWIAYNPTRSEATAARDKMASGGAIGNHRRWHVGRGVVDAQCAYCVGPSGPDEPDRDAPSGSSFVTSARPSNASGRASGAPDSGGLGNRGETDATSRGQPKPDRPPDRPPDGVPESGANPPSRPDPSLSGTGTSHLSPSVGGAGGGAPNRRDRGTRLPDEFLVTDELASWARTNAPLCGRTDHDSFCDYWRAVPGAKGRKVDWPATWKNWMRREQERRQGNGRGSPGNVIALRDRPATSDQRANQAKEAGRLLQEQIDAGKEITA